MLCMYFAQMWKWGFDSWYLSATTDVTNLHRNNIASSNEQPTATSFKHVCLSHASISKSGMSITLRLTHFTSDGFLMLAPRWSIGGTNIRPKGWEEETPRSVSSTKPTQAKPSMMSGSKPLIRTKSLNDQHENTHGAIDLHPIHSVQRFV